MNADVPMVALSNRAWALPDVVRAWLYRAAAPVLGPLYADRERRVFWLAVFSVASSFALTVGAPLWLLTVGPLVLGVPHLLADVRYLVVRPALHRRRAAWFAVVPLVAVGLGAPPVVGVFAAAPLVLSGPGWWPRRVAVLAALSVLAVSAVVFERQFLLAFVHLHNLVALALWWAMRPRGASAVGVLALVAVATAALLTGKADGVLTALDGWEAPATGTSFEDFIDATAPVADGRLAAHLVLSFAFLQSLHYGVWLRLIPDDARERRAPRPFAASWRALVQELGTWPMVAVLVLALGIAGWGAVDPGGARTGYLRLGAFHGYLELAVAAWLVAAAKRPAQ
jgi:hypothetical protein